jgi:O-succinylbenzoate synthase
MKIESVELHHVELPFLHPFESSRGIAFNKTCIIISVHSEGITGYGECAAEAGPWYSEETVATAWHILEEFLIPQVIGKDMNSIEEVMQKFSPVRGNRMAKAGLESAFWDLFAKANSVSLSKMMGGVRDKIPVGVSIGIQSSINKLLEVTEKHLSEGYKRIKLKIKPGCDVDVVKAVRERWQDILLQVDANSAYTLEQIQIFRELDQFNLLLIEQPLHYADIMEHSKLQALIKTPVCLDESIYSFEQAKLALKLNACKVINIKPGRVGGFTNAIKIHDLCNEKGIPVWCGGMFETNIGRAGNTALASLSNFTLPGDISASARYFKEDIAVPDFVLNSDSTLTVPSKPGIGVEPVPDRLSRYRVRYKSFPT